MASLKLRPRARRDMESIWSHSADRWSPEQADLYLRGLETAFRGLLSHPERGQAIDEIRASYRMLRAGSHLILYRPVRDRIEIVRVLHERMDPGRHF